jgi:hypothetical protein
MNDNLPSDPLDAAIAAFVGMEVPAPPADAQVLEHLPTGANGRLEPARQSAASPGKFHRYLVAASIAAVVVITGGVVVILRPPTPRQPPKNETVASAPRPPAVAPTPDHGGSPVAVAAPRDDSPQRAPAALPHAAANMTLARAVANAQVIVVGKALGGEVVAPKRQGDLSEYGVRYQVERVLKGKLRDETIVTRTPTSPDEFIGKEWILVLSPEFIAGTNPYAAWTTRATAETEANVKNLLRDLEK